MNHIAQIISVGCPSRTETGPSPPNSLRLHANKHTGAKPADLQTSPQPSLGSPTVPLPSFEFPPHPATSKASRRIQGTCRRAAPAPARPPPSASAERRSRPAAPRRLRGVALPPRQGFLPSKGVRADPEWTGQATLSFVLPLNWSFQKV